MSLEKTKPPTQVPGYEPVRLLGEGAFGEVWVARQRNTGQQVAVKFYTRRGGVDWSLLSREVEKLAFLTSDRYIVSLVEVGWDADPPYYIMEYLEHGSLEDRLEEGTLSAEEAVSLLKEVATGLTHAHGKGVLHCDLKPANVLLDQDGKPRLCDFGQARLTDEQAHSLGTLFFMAPEQADMQAVPDARWDVYALGALVYCMLTGEPPYRSKQNIERIEACDALKERLAVYREIIRESSAPEAHRHVPGVDRSLGDIIDRCLAPQPGKRYANVQSLLGDLEDRRRRRSRRPLLIMGTLGPVLLLLVMGIFGVKAFRVAMSESKTAVTIRAKEIHSLAARHVAARVAGKINHRWDTLELESGKFPQIIQDHSFVKEVRGLTGKEREDKIAAMREQPPEQNPAFVVLQALKERYDADLQATSWFLLDEWGNQLARAPYDAKNVFRNWAFRNYFHGGEKGDVPEDADRDELQPIDAPHMSHVFVSKTTHKPMVAFSVPVWVDEQQKTKVAGVLAMTVELGGFTELFHDNRNVVTSLLDIRPDSSPQRRRGALLEHPVFHEQQQNGKAAKAIYLDEGITRDLERAYDPSAPPAADNNDLEIRDDYIDPAVELVEGKWQAALQPVVVNDKHSGWVVVVQEPRREMLSSVTNLGTQLRNQAILALLVLVAVVAALWAFVILTLKGPSQNRIIAAVRKRIGLTSHSSSIRGTGAAGKTQPNAARGTTRKSEAPNAKL